MDDINNVFTKLKGDEDTSFKLMPDFEKIIVLA